MDPHLRSGTPDRLAMPKPEDHTPLGESIGEIIDRTTKIVHEEIELAKAEMAAAAQDLLRGSVAGIVGGVFAFFGLFILLIAFSFLVADAVGAWYPWLGFFIVAFICFIVGGLLAFVALKKIKKGSQLAPTQAIDEAKQTKSALQAEAEKDVETIDSTAVEEATAVKPPAATHPKVEPLADPVKTPEVAEAEAAADEAKEDLKEARVEADELELDAKEAKKRAKQEAKEAKEAEKAAKKAEQEAAKAEAIAAKQAEKAQKEADKAKAKAEKEAEKNAKKAAKASGNTPEQPAAEPEAPAPAPDQPQRYVAPQPPTTPPAPPTSGGPTPPPTPPAPPTDPTENN